MKNKLFFLLFLLFTGFYTSEAKTVSFDTETLESTSHLFIYPNPATSEVHVLLPGIAVNKVTVYILDFNGTLLRSFFFAPGGDEVNVDISSLPTGTYSLRVQEQGSLPENILVVKQ